MSDRRPGWSDWAYWLIGAAACCVGGYAVYRRFSTCPNPRNGIAQFRRQRDDDPDVKAPESDVEETAASGLSESAARFLDEYDRFSKQHHDSAKLPAGSAEQQFGSAAQRWDARLRDGLRTDPTFDLLSIEPSIQTIPRYADLVRRRRLASIKLLDMHARTVRHFIVSFPQARPDRTPPDRF